jgi:hypothetical protein
MWESSPRPRATLLSLPSSHQQRNRGIVALLGILGGYDKFKLAHNGGEDG